ncbi:hypothetical protein [Marimonas arenosa]|uniref:YiaAB two helix domain-containing protein n=1 Tax=Marimonas arenosa TaxID=1795305 RepID=A0AAE4B5Y1_9RHOB|nr:hypothetical protein [Marimonas arenosa]MDQ2091642.1 hypothetical protein [Marimonas arenosa]
MLNTTKTDNTLIMLFNGAGAIAASVLLGLSLYLSTDVPLSTKSYWGIGVLMLTFGLVNFVEYRFDTLPREGRPKQLEDAKNERLLEEFIAGEET